MDELAPEYLLPRCPNCGSDKTHRAVRRKSEERVFRRELFQSPYRCEACEHRFFSFRVPRPPKERPKSKIPIPGSDPA